MANGFPVAVNRLAGQPISSAQENALAAAVNTTAPAKISAIGDLVVGIGENEIDRLEVGSNNQVLVADSNQTCGVKWSTNGGACRLSRLDAAQTISDTTITDVEFDTEDFDTAGFADLTVSASKITIPSGMDGVYTISFGVAGWVYNANGSRQVRLYQYNSSDETLRSIIFLTDIDYDRFQSTVIWDLAEGDYLKMQVYQSRGGTLDLTNGDLTSLSVALLYKGA